MANRGFYGLFDPTKKHGGKGAEDAKIKELEQRIQALEAKVQILESKMTTGRAQ